MFISSLGYNQELDDIRLIAGLPIIWPCYQATGKTRLVPSSPLSSNSDSFPYWKSPVLSVISLSRDETNIWPPSALDAIRRVKITVLP
jgi:hypothetical protein